MKRSFETMETLTEMMKEVALDDEKTETLKKTTEKTEKTEKTDN